MMLIRFLKKVNVGIRIFYPGDVIEAEDAEVDYGLDGNELDRLERRGAIEYEEG